MYTEKLIKHFQEPHNVGVMEDADIVGEAGKPYLWRYHDGLSEDGR